MHRIVKIVLLRLIVHGHRIIKVVAVQTYVKFAWLRQHERRVQHKVSAHIRELERDDLAMKIMEIDLY